MNRAQNRAQSRARYRAGRALAALLFLAPVAAHGGQAATACAVAAAPTTGPRLHVVVSGARRVAGNVTFTLYGDDPARFLAHHGSLALVRVTLTSSTAEACFAVSAAGSYAVAAYHDENDNHRFDRTLLGLPAEGYGFSNNVNPLFGLPSFESVRFHVGPQDTSIGIGLRY